MAFAQQQRRRTTLQRSVSSSEIIEQQFLTPSDSENDWHVISSASNHSSPILFPSESESSFRPSDTEESDFQTSGGEEDETSFLPSHDGTGTFIVEEAEFFSSDQATTTSEEDDEEEDDEEENELKSALQNLTSDNSILDMILLQQHGTPPSFAKSPPSFQPTTAGIKSQELLLGVVSGDEEDRKVMSNTLISDGDETPHIKFTSRSQKNLDRIPVHHPGATGSSTPAALLSLMWDSLKKLTNHLLENDTNTIETLSTIMSEAVLEGCIPFGSHLHMEIENHHYHHHSLLEGCV